MKLPTQIEFQLNNFLKPKIKFNSFYNQYTFDDKWLIDVTDNLFKNEVLQILKEVNNHLIVGLNTREFLEYLRIIIDKRLDYYSSVKSRNEIGFIKYDIPYSSINEEVLNTPKPEKFDLQDIVKEKKSVIDLIHDEDSYYQDLFRLKKLFNEYSNTFDVEQVKLSYVIELHENYVLLLFHYVGELLDDYNNVNFEMFDFDSLLLSYNLIHAPSESQKCHVNLSKIDVANLFHLLLDEKIIFFDRNERQNKVLMQQFIESHFTYKDDDGLQKNISNFNKQISMVGYSNSPSHKAFIDSLLLKLEDRKLNVK
jgi:hypothetical protein